MCGREERWREGEGVGWGEGKPTVQPGGLASRIETDYDQAVLPTIQETLRLCVRRVLGRSVTVIFPSRGWIIPPKTDPIKRLASHEANGTRVTGSKRWLSNEGDTQSRQ